MNTQALKGNKLKAMKKPHRPMSSMKTMPKKLVTRGDNSDLEGFIYTDTV